jgi:hypothetical protein
MCMYTYRKATLKLKSKKSDRLIWQSYIVDVARHKYEYHLALRKAYCKLKSYKLRLTQ